MGNVNSSKSYITLKNEFKTDVLNEMTKRIENTFNTTTINECTTIQNQENKVSDRIVVGDNNKLSQENKAKFNFKCAIDKTATSELQTLLVSALQASVDAKMNTDIKRQVEQEAKNGWLAIGANVQKDFNSQSTTNKVDTSLKNIIDVYAKNEFTDTVINTSKGLLNQTNEVNLEVVKGNNNTIKQSNDAEVFIKNEVMQKALSNVVEQIDSSLKLEQKLESFFKSNNKTKQKSTNIGVEGVLAGIFSVTGGILILCCVVFFIVMLARGGNSSSSNSNGSS